MEADAREPHVHLAWRGCQQRRARRKAGSTLEGYQMSVLRSV